MIERLALVAVLVALSTLAGRWWQSRQGRVRRADAAPSDVAAAVLFTTPTCRTCPQVRTNLDAVAAVHADFRWTEVDAASDLDRARAHRVLRAPTVLFTDAAGAEVSRASGLLTAQAIAVAAALDPAVLEVAA